jgi:hypothetical protein
MNRRLGRALFAAAVSLLAICACLDHSGAFLGRKDTAPPDLVSVCSSAAAAADAGADGGALDGGSNCTLPLTLARTDGLVVTFSKTMDSRSLFQGIAVLRGAENVPISLSFQPSEEFPESAQGISSPYSVSVAAASGRFDAYPEYTLLLSTSLSDIAGNPLAAEKRTNFKVQ